MGVFTDAEKVKFRSRLDEIKQMDTEDIEDLLVRPAERRLEEAFSLDLDTDAQPRRLVQWFVRRPDKLVEFNRDMEICVILLIDRMQSNPHQHGNQVVGRSSVTFGPRMPQEVVSIMAQWAGTGGKTGRIVRT